MVFHLEMAERPRELAASLPACLAASLTACLGRFGCVGRLGRLAAWLPACMAVSKQASRLNSSHCSA